MIKGGYWAPSGEVRRKVASARALLNRDNPFCRTHACKFSDKAVTGAFFFLALR